MHMLFVCLFDLGFSIFCCLAYLHGVSCSNAAPWVIEYSWRVCAARFLKVPPICLIGGGTQWNESLSKVQYGMSCTRVGSDIWEIVQPGFDYMLWNWHHNSFRKWVRWKTIKALLGWSVCTGCFHKAPPTSCIGAHSATYIKQCNEGGKVGRCDATLINFFSSNWNIFNTTINFFDGSGITPSYFPALMKWWFWSYPSFHYFGWIGCAI